MKRKCIAKSVVTLAVCISMVIPAKPVSAADYEFRVGGNFGDYKLYWYEYGIKQGTVNDTQGILGDGTNRGREIFDSKTNGWYWLDSVYGGAMAVGKEVWIPYIYQEELIMSADGNGRIANGISDEVRIKELAQASVTSEADMSAQVEDAIRNMTGKWVRYDENGVMLKGWVAIEGTLAECYPDQVGNVYYYDQQTGLMAKGNVTINGVQYHFDEITGVLDYDGLKRNSEGYVVLGSYEQDNNLRNGKEPIEWVILDKNENGTLLVSRYVLDGVRYNTESAAVTWETCSLRKWMNNDFLNSAFTAEEQAKIATTNVVNVYTYYGIEGGNDTEDKIFCLSADEILKYGYYNNLITYATPYAENKHVYVSTIDQDYFDEYIKNRGYIYATDCVGLSKSSWWLRSSDGSGAAYSSMGVANLNCICAVPSYHGVRPALYIAK